MKLAIRNFPFTVTNDDLRALFEQFGSVSDAYVIFDKVTRVPRGFGFVEMPNAEQAWLAIETLDRYHWCGRLIYVNEAVERTAYPKP